MAVSQILSQMAFSRTKAGQGMAEYKKGKDKFEGVGTVENPSFEAMTSF